MMQAKPPIPPPVPTQVQTAPSANVVTTGALTSRDVAALRARASELSTQIRSATSRRNETRTALRNATGADRAGLEQRLGVLDTRIARLETDIDENGKQLASLDAQRATTSDAPFAPRFSRGRFDRVADSLVPIVVVFTIFVLCPIALSISRYLWKRSSAPRQAPPNPESAERLERMEQAIDSIAIEMERVSEGQRFVTRLLAEGRQPSSIAASQPQSVGVPR